MGFIIIVIILWLIFGNKNEKDVEKNKDINDTKPTQNYPLRNQTPEIKISEKKKIEPLIPLIPKISDRRNGINYKALFEYYPTRYQVPEISFEDVENRRSVWNFKDGYSTEKFSLLLSRALKSMHSDETLKSAILLPIPASTSFKTENRYEVLLETISKKTGIINGYSYINNTIDHEAKHLNGGFSSLISTLEINNSMLRGKHIILLDDVITRGNNLRELSNRLINEVGVLKIEGLFLAQTTHI